MLVKLKPAFSSNKEITNQFIEYKGSIIGVFSSLVLFKDDPELLKITALSMEGAYLIMPCQCRGLDKAIDLLNSVDFSQFEEVASETKNEVSFYQICIRSKLGFLSLLSKTRSTCGRDSMGLFFVERFDSAGEANAFITGSTKEWADINLHMLESFGDAIDSFVVQAVYEDESVVNLNEVEF